MLWIHIGFSTDRIQHFRSVWIRICVRRFDEQKWKNFTSWKKIIVYCSKSKIEIPVHFQLGLHKWRPSYRRSLHPPKENVQHFKTWNFFTFSVSFCPPGSAFPMLIWIQPTKVNADPYGSGSTIHLKKGKSRVYPAMHHVQQIPTQILKHVWKP